MPYIPLTAIIALLYDNIVKISLRKEFLDILLGGVQDKLRT